MSTADPRVLSRVQAEFSRVDEEALVILKGHLLIEERLNAILEKFVFHPEFLEKAGLRFYQKVQLARSISITEHQSQVWDMIAAINSLRNELAHTLNSPNREKKRDVVISIYSRMLAEDHPELDEKEWDSHVRLAFAATYCVGFLEAFEREVTRFRSIVDTLHHVWNVEPLRKDA